MINKLIRILMLLITLICLAASIYYSGLWHLYVQMSPLLAWSLAAAFVIFANVCFDIGVGMFRNYLRKSDGRFIIFGIIFMLLWALITVYSIGSTIAGQYNQMLLQQAHVYEVSETQLSINLLQTELETLQSPLGTDIATRDILIDDINRRISTLEIEQKNITQTLSSIDSIETSANYRTTILNNRNRLEIVIEDLDILYAQKTELLLPPVLDTDRIQELQTEISMLKLKRDANITDAEKLSLYDDIFDFFAGVLNTHSNTVQFITSIFPAILIDLLSPISSALFFYGVSLGGKSGGKRKDEDNDNNRDNTGDYKRGTQDAFKAVNTEIRKRLG